MGTQLRWDPLECQGVPKQLEFGINGRLIKLELPWDLLKSYTGTHLESETPFETNKTISLDPLRVRDLLVTPYNPIPGPLRVKDSFGIPKLISRGLLTVRDFMGPPAS